MQSINLNLVPGSFQQVFNCSQGDIGRQLTAKLFDGSTEYAIPAGSTVKIKATKPSGFGFDESATFSGSTVTITTAETMTNEWGRFPAELVITKDGNVIGTANFLFNIEKNPHPDLTVDGDAEEVIPELTLLVERVEAAASSVLDMEVVATTLPAGSQASYSYDEDLNKATFGIPQGEAGAGAAGVVASAYSSSKTYKVGDYVLHNSNLYRCTTAITTAEAFTAAHWTQIVLADDVSDLKTDLIYSSPDSYSGTDSEKIQQAVNAISATGGIVTINRAFTLTDDIVISHNSNLTTLIEFVATSKDAELNFSTYKFVGSTGDHSGAKGGIKFSGLHIKGSGVAIDMSSLVRVYFSGCTIDGFSSLFYSSSYIQTAYIFDSVVRDSTDALIAIASVNSGGQLYDVRISGNTIERGKSLIIGVSPRNVIVSNNCIEGLDDTLITFTGACISFSFVNNYLENNGTAVPSIDLSLIPRGYRINANIVGNLFVETRDNGNYGVIKLPKEEHLGTIAVVGNALNGDNSQYYFVESTNAVLSNVVFVGNTGNGSHNGLLTTSVVNIAPWMINSLCATQKANAVSRSALSDTKNRIDVDFGSVLYPTIEIDETDNGVNQVMVVCSPLNRLGNLTDKSIYEANHDPTSVVDLTPDKIILGVAGGYIRPSYITDYTITDNTITVNAGTHINYGIGIPLAVKGGETLGYRFNTTDASCNIRINYYDKDNKYLDYFTLQKNTDATTVVLTNAKWAAICVCSGTENTTVTAELVYVGEASPILSRQNVYIIDISTVANGAVKSGRIDWETGILTVLTGNNTGTYAIKLPDIMAVKGTNIVFADCGNVSTLYNADLSKIISDIELRISALE